MPLLGTAAALALAEYVVRGVALWEQEHERQPTRGLLEMGMEPLWIGQERIKECQLVDDMGALACRQIVEIERQLICMLSVAGLTCT